MSQNDIQALCQEYREYARMIEEMEAVKDSIGDKLKAYMTETEQTKAIVGQYKLSFTNVTRSDIDKKQLQAEHPEVYNAYLKETSYKRFLVS